MIYDLISRLDKTRNDTRKQALDENSKWEWFTDSEEERDFHYALKNDQDLKDLTDPLYFKKLRKEYEEMYQNEMQNIDKSEYDISRVYEYPESDIEDHIAKVRKELPNAEVNWSYDEEGRKVVALTHQVRNKYKLPEVQRMYDKYKEAAKSPNFEVDTEDEAFFRDLENGFDPQRFVDEIGRQFEVEEVKELGDLSPDIEGLKSLGMMYGTYEMSEELKEYPDFWKQFKQQIENPDGFRMYKREEDYDDEDMLDERDENQARQEAMEDPGVIDVESSKE